MQLAPLIFIDYSMVLCEGAIKLSLSLANRLFP